MAITAWLASEASVSTSSASNPRTSGLPTASTPMVDPPRWRGADSRATARPGSTKARMASASAASAGPGAAIPCVTAASSGSPAEARSPSCPSGRSRSSTATSAPSSSRAYETTAWRTWSRPVSAAIDTDTRLSARVEALAASSSAFRDRRASVRRSMRRKA